MKRLISVVIVILFVLSLFTITNATKGDKTSYVPTQSNYADFFDSVMKSDEWLETEDRIVRGEMLQLPIDMIKAMDTATLVDAVLDYPYFRDIYAFDDMQVGVGIIFANFNGTQELSQRPDVADVLIDKYTNSEVLSPATIRLMDKEAVGDTVYELSNIEVLLAQDFVTQRLGDAGVSDLSEIVYKKYTEKIQSPAYGTATNTFYRVFDTVCDDATVVKSPISTKASGTYVYTPNGSSVYVLSLGEQLSSEQIASNHNWVSTNYPSAVRIGNSTTRYNCHSYAWYFQSHFGNHYWMNNPSAYWTDGSYTNYSLPMKSDRMIWVTNGSVTHSGTVFDRLAGPVYPPYGYTDLVLVTSKWGQLGLYRHNGISSPYWVANTYTTFFR